MESRHRWHQEPAAAPVLRAYRRFTSSASYPASTKALANVRCADTGQDFAFNPILRERFPYFFSIYPESYSLTWDGFRGRVTLGEGRPLPFGAETRRHFNRQRGASRWTTREETAGWYTINDGISLSKKVCFLEFGTAPRGPREQQSSWRHMLVCQPPATLIRDCMIGTAFIPRNLAQQQLSAVPRDGVVTMDYFYTTARYLLDTRFARNERELFSRWSPEYAVLSNVTVRSTAREDGLKATCRFISIANHGRMARARETPGEADQRQRVGNSDKFKPPGYEFEWVSFIGSEVEEEVEEVED